MSVLPTRIRRRIGATLVAGAALTGTFAIGVPAADAATHHRIAYFVVGGTEGHQTAVAHGAVNGGGKDVSRDSVQYDVLHLGGGTLRINHPDKGTRFHIKAFNHTTCYLRFVTTGKYTLGHGTGRFAGVTGKGKYSGKGYGILARTSSGACDMNAKPRAEVFYIHAHGRVNLP